MIAYVDSAESTTPEQLRGFFAGWPNPPTPETHLRLLMNSDAVVLALDDETGNVVGFVTAISDGVPSAYIPHLEVLEPYRGQGIGTALMRRMLEKLGDLYMVDLMCDPDLQPFYARLGLQPSTGMIGRNYARQSGDGDGTIASA
jgi:ribosomal protein S18 acetylase RimI-like enzyme